MSQKRSVVGFQFLVIFLVFICHSSSVFSSPLPQPSSAWNQPALAINTINSGNSESNKKGLNNPTASAVGTSGGGGNPGSTTAGSIIGTILKGKNNNNGNGNELKRKKYSWSTIMHYGVSGGSDHNIRHKAKKLRDHSKLPCPFDQIRSWWDGKCRPAPRFSLYRVGR